MPMPDVLSPEEFFARLEPLYAQGGELTQFLQGALEVYAPITPETLGIEPPIERHPDDQALYDACETDIELFARTFFTHYCQAEFSKMHKNFFAQWRDEHGMRGLRDATAAPRGHAKSSLRCIIKSCHAVCYGLEKYILIIGSRHDLAKDRVMDIKRELESNDGLIRVFGPQIGEIWNLDDIITRRGVRIRAAGPGSGMRGLLWGPQRISLILLDDAEKDETVKSETQRAKFEAWFNDVVANLGNLAGPWRTNIDVIGTVEYESLLAKLLRNPGYRHHWYQAVLHFAEGREALALWQQWRDIIIDLTNEHRLSDAQAFFEAHQEAMLAGSEVLWPQWETYYDLMVYRIVQGDDSFWKEKQNQPQASSHYPFQASMDQAGYFTLHPDHLMRRDGRQISLAQITDLVAYYDPALGEDATSGNPDWACCVIVGKDMFGYYYVLDCYITQTDDTNAQIQAITAMCWKWRVQRIGIERNGFQSLLVSDLREAIARQNTETGTWDWDYLLIPVTNTKNKVMRIMTLQPMIANRWLWFSDALPYEYFRQFRDFRRIKDAGKDDACDGTDGAVRVSKMIIDRRSAA